MLKENQLIELMDGTNYLILDKTNYENKSYLYVAKVDDDSNPTGEFDIVLEKIVEEIPTLEYVENEELYETLKLTFLERSDINSNI